MLIVQLSIAHPHVTFSARAPAALSEASSVIHRMPRRHAVGAQRRNKLIGNSSIFM
jgi:hypothetical protein